MLLVTLMVIPLIGALILFFVQDKTMKTSRFVSLIVLVLAAFGLKNALVGIPLTYEIGLSGPFVLNFQADALSAIFVLLTAFIWFIVSIYSQNYMQHESKAWSYQLSSLFTLFSILGIFLAANLLTMLLFFEMMTISSYFLVVNRWDESSIKAGKFYLFFSIVGGFLVTLGIVLMYGAVGNLPIIGSGVVTPLNPKLFAWSIAMFLVGFGIKAGMVPLHTWLPYAHSEAPVPGSALLSGIIIKVGAYGLIRTGEFAGWGIKLATEITWVGSTFILLGIITMTIGVIAALIQSDAKKLLAYHSVSQIGYIILGLGISLYLGSESGFGLSGSIYHIINHALFKVALFLGVGIIYIRTGERNLYKLGGLWRQLPWTAILMLIAVLGITGTPGLNGYASKSLLHRGVSLAAETGGSWLVVVEGLFLLVGVGTAASFSKLYYLTFLGKPTKLKINNIRLPKLHIAMALITVVMIGIGIRPELLLNIGIIPAVKKLGIENISTVLTGLSFWKFKDVFEMIITLALGVVVCWGGFKSGAFHWRPPIWMTIEGIARWTGKGIITIIRFALKYYHALIKLIKNAIESVGLRLEMALHKFDKSKSSVVFGVDLVGTAADVAILILILGILIGIYTLSNIILP